MRKVEQRSIDLFEKFKDAVDNDLSITVKDIARKLKVSEPTLRNAVNRCGNISARHYITVKRYLSIKKLIKAQGCDINDIVRLTGLSSKAIDRIFIEFDYMTFAKYRAKLLIKSLNVKKC